MVASGQFLVDSEASLTGIPARPINAPPPMTAPVPRALIEGVGRIEQIGPTSVTLSHEPIPAAGWPAMTMTFTMANPSVGRGHTVGERVRFGFEQAAGRPIVRRMASEAAPR